MNCVSKQLYWYNYIAFWPSSLGIILNLPLRHNNYCDILSFILQENDKDFNLVFYIFIVYFDGKWRYEIKQTIVCDWLKKLRHLFFVLKLPVLVVWSKANKNMGSSTTWNRGFVGKLISKSWLISWWRAQTLNHYKLFHWPWSVIYSRGPVESWRHYTPAIWLVLVILQDLVTL